MSDLTKYHVFLSYSRHDDEWVWKLVTRLEQEEWQERKLKVFFATRDIEYGNVNLLRIEEALLASCTVVLVMTPDSMNSPWVRDERVMAHDIMRVKGKDCLIPVLLKDCDVPLLTRTLCRVNFTDPDKFEEKYQELVAAIKTLLRSGCCLSKPDPDEPPLLSEFIPRPPSIDFDPSYNDKQLFLSRFIPRPPTISFVPRYNDKQQDVLEIVKAELAPSKNQLVALWGPGGMGKTTLAIMVARQMFEAFNGRVIWINANLRSKFSLSTMLDIIASRLGQGDLRAYGLEQKKEEIGELVNHMAPLIILDNFETIKPDEQKQCEQWLEGNVSCPVLITTRERVDSALNIAIGRMSLTAAREFLKLLIKEESQNE